MKKQLLISLAILAFLFIATTIVVLYGRGYRFWFEKGKPDISGTGLLVVKSKPDGAQVFINDHLTTATDSTINLSEGVYTVRIYKDGYFPWQKKITMQKEVVIKLQASLFATAPRLESITTVGVGNPTIDPSKTKIAYTVASGSAQKNGLYVLDLTTRPLLTLQSSSTQIVDNTIEIFSNAQVLWSPDGKNLLASASSSIRIPTSYLLAASEFNNAPRNITATITSLLANWDSERNEKERARREALKLELRKIISYSFDIIEWSPDETKILYTASNAATIPIIIKPPLIGSNQTTEQRSIENGSIYVYDIKEDKNFKIEIGNSQTPQNLSWLSDSLHLLFVKDKKIHIVSYDGENDTIIYAGPFFENYVFPSPNDTKVVILTNLGNLDISPNLYTLGLQ